MNLSLKQLRQAQNKHLPWPGRGRTYESDYTAICTGLARRGAVSGRGVK